MKENLCGISDSAMHPFLLASLCFAFGAVYNARSLKIPFHTVICLPSPESFPSRLKKKKKSISFFSTSLKSIGSGISWEWVHLVTVSDISPAPSRGRIWTFISEILLFKRKRLKQMLPLPSPKTSTLSRSFPSAKSTWTSYVQGSSTCVVNWACTRRDPTSWVCALLSLSWNSE